MPLVVKGTILDLRKAKCRLPSGNGTTGGEIWRTSDGINWSQVNTDGFGSGDNTSAVTVEVFDGKLYAGTWNSATGGQIWRSPNGATWEQVMQDGFGKAENKDIAGLIPFRGGMVSSS